MSILSQTVQNLKPSQTIAISTKAAELRAAGRDVIALSAGEPDFDTPETIKDAAKAAMDAGETKYTAPDGTPVLKDAIIEKFSRENGLTFTRDDVIASTGGKQVIFNALMATLNPSDEVIIQAPHWVSYPDMVGLCGGTPVTIQTTAEDKFILSPDALEAAITPKTKWLMLNSPGNPSGAVYSAEALAGLAEVLCRHPHVWVMCDDMYEHLVYGVSFATMAVVAPDLKDRVLTVNGVSKAYAMTGWRIGYAGGPAPLIKAMKSVQSQSTSNPSSISQAAAAAALVGPQDYIAMSVPVFNARRDMIVAALNDCPGVECLTPDGAFYVFPSIAGAIGKKTVAGKTLSTDEDVSLALLDDEDVALVHGSAFGTPGHLRLSYAASDAALSEAATRMKRFFESLTDA
ncbi:MAG: pyridoxal phosphate-dependent aminotransferase [Pseudomonadota bacterium]